jgi:hypothetical protein
MSYDLNLTTLCDHLVFKELTFLETDAQTIYLSRPVASSTALTVWITGNVLPFSFYNLITNPDTTNPSQVRYIKLNQPWPSPTDYFEINYITRSPFCTKCQGFNYLDDISYDINGDIVEISNEPLLMQNIEKFVITEIGSNPFFTFIGSGLGALIGTRVTNPQFLISQITSQITNSLNQLKSLQQQYALTGRPMTPGELLATINNISVQQDNNDPTIFRADISVTAQSGNTVQTTQVIKAIG